MSSDLNRPIIGIDKNGNRFFEDPEVLLSRVSLVVSLYARQSRAELFEYKPGMALSGHLVWQHHVRTHTAQDGAGRLAAGMLGHTSEWLGKQGWPGIAL